MYVFLPAVQPLDTISSELSNIQCPGLPTCCLKLSLSQEQFSCHFSLQEYVIIMARNRRSALGRPQTLVPSTFSPLNPAVVPQYISKKAWLYSFKKGKCHATLGPHSYILQEILWEVGLFNTRKWGKKSPELFFHTYHFLVVKVQPTPFCRQILSPHLHQWNRLTGSRIPNWVQEDMVLSLQHLSPLDGKHGVRPSVCARQSGLLQEGRHLSWQEHLLPLPPPARST